MVNGGMAESIQNAASGAMPERPPGVYYDTLRRRWFYQPDPFDADDCESIAALIRNDGWADDLLEAAAYIRAAEGGAGQDGAAGHEVTRTDQPVS